MDNDQYTQFVLELALALDGFLTLCASVQYIAARRLYKSFTKALNNGINSVSLESNEEPSYCVVRGHVKGLAPLIKSLSKPNEKGVIQNLTIKEHATRRLNGIWENQKNLLDSQFNAVPFEIRDDKFRVIVKSCSEAHYLHLPVIEDHFEPSDSNILGLLFGIHHKGFQFTEYLLRENDVVTGFGEIVVGANQKLELIPPKNGLKYILTTTDPETLAIKLKSDRDFYRITASILGFIGLTIAGVLFYQWWKRKQILLRRERLLEMATRARLERQRTQPRNQLSEDSFTCIVCLNQPREVILLPCGHISMCYDCAYQCNDRPCPVCREPVASINLIYFS
ncbi:hypothetical protein V9T40_002492 [Parthenolecanium corni]|uniref:RING-type E3 ubiquitin transferase n=1 Tax=Parthenolecanium corni TaxID=536013 RepID=A0AAN9TKK2_9HEMI